MKIVCLDCGVHFPDEFKKALKCSFWKTRGGEKLSNKAKKIVWDWQFSFPYDDFGEKYGYMLNVGWGLIPYTGNSFTGSNPKYVSLSEAEKKELQKDWYKFVTRVSDKDKDKLLWQAFEKGSKKWSKKLT
jgi:hypothetical protein